MPTSEQAESTDLGMQAVDTAWGTIDLGDLPATETGMQDQILDAALRCFSARGVKGTSMAVLAREARISRAWLYRNFECRDAIVRALLVREGRRLAEVLVAADRPERNTEETVTETFIYVIGYGRQHLLFREIADQDTGPLARATVDALENYLIDRRKIAGPDARFAAETIVRLIISILTTPDLATDFGNKEELRTYAYRVIPPLLSPRA